MIRVLQDIQRWQHPNTTGRSRNVLPVATILANALPCSEAAAFDVRKSLKESELVMDWGDLRDSRSRAINAMNHTLENMKPGRLPRWVCNVGIVPLVMFWIIFEACRAIYMLLMMWAELIFAILFAPFRVLWFWIDISSMSIWYFRLLAKKMSGEKL